MTRILLVRSAWHESIAKSLAGRSDVVGLLPQGRLQAVQIAANLDRLDVTRIQTSPRRRARESAEPAAARIGIEPEIVPALDDMDFGLWTGVSLVALDRDPDWSAWNNDREAWRPPGGESMQQLQERIMSHLAAMLRVDSRETIAMFTHAEPIRAAILDERNLSLNQFAQIEVEPGGVFELGADSSSRRILAVA